MSAEQLLAYGREIINEVNLVIDGEIAYYQGGTDNCSLGVGKCFCCNMNHQALLALRGLKEKINK